MSELSGGIQYLLNNTKKYPILKRQEQIDLWQEYKNGDPAARHKLLLHNIKYIVKMANKYKKLTPNPKISLEDLVQQGVIGFLRSLDKYKPEKRESIVTCAYWWIRAEILNYIDMNKYTTYVTRYKNRKRKDIFEYSLNAPALLGSENLEYIDILEDKEALKNMVGGLDLQYRRKTIIKAMECLDEREKIIIKKRYLSEETQTLAAIGKSWSLSRERIRQLEARALKKLKNCIEQEAA